jgi:hypothetical protein
MFHLLYDLSVKSIGARAQIRYDVAPNAITDPHQKWTDSLALKTTLGFFSSDNTWNGSVQNFSVKVSSVEDKSQEFYESKCDVERSKL